MTDLRSAPVPELRADDHLRGPITDPPAPLVVFYGDFACPHCQEYHPTITQYLNDYVMTNKAKFEYRVFPNSGECTEATSAGAVDVAFMPVDEERRKKVAFGPAYYLLESTYLVSGPSGIPFRLLAASSARSFTASS